MTTTLRIMRLADKYARAKEDSHLPSTGSLIKTARKELSREVRALTSSPVFGVELDLTKGDDRNYHDHPDIKTDGTLYLCEVFGGWFTGKFRRSWYGLTFDGWRNPSLQYDKPGHNSSAWTRVIELDMK